jgi:hypothetical protein
MRDSHGPKRRSDKALGGSLGDFNGVVSQPLRQLFAPNHGALGAQKRGLSPVASGAIMKLQ